MWSLRPPAQKPCWATRRLPSTQRMKGTNPSWQNLILPLVGREIPVIADSYVEKDFGTGCVKITPCHDPNDFEVGKRHGLEEILVIDSNARIINGGKYNGMDRYEARKAIVSDLEAQGLL